MLGPAPVVDFDGTLARLDVAWSALRRAAGVQRIDELWARSGVAVWDEITRAEALAANTAAALDAVLGPLEHTKALAVLTSNSQASVHAFLGRFPALEDKVKVVVGRETLAGPKTDFAVFTHGFRLCVDATATARDGGPVVYVGDMDYELEFAQRLGAVPISVATLEADA
jgi:hypothetical protein